jgi:glutamate-1-semialdehyde aminotransferase
MRDKLKDDAAKNYEFSMGMVVNGVYLSPAHTAALCFAHTQEDIDYILRVTEKVLKEMKQ